jgi:hypothetical protein
MVTNQQLWPITFRLQSQNVYCRVTKRSHCGRELDPAAARKWTRRCSHSAQRPGPYPAQEYARSFSCCSFFSGFPRRCRRQVISRSFFFLTRKMKRNATRRCWHRRQNGSGELRAEHSKPPSTSQYNIVPSAQCVETQHAASLHEPWYKPTLIPGDFSSLPEALSIAGPLPKETVLCITCCSMN